MNILIAVESPLLRAAITDYIFYLMPNAVLYSPQLEGDLARTGPVDIAVVDPELYTPASLLTGVKKIFTTDKPLSGRLLLRAFYHADQKSVRPTHTLSDGERDVMRHLLAGRSNKEIAALAGISLASVKFYVRKLCTKMGVKNRTQLAVMARDDD